ncbi:MAG TPA: glycosyl hydrolase, partial [Casimicrobiaceae bacterium]|nr:glycosyl hydrolase [Casimicrobiaceae bacterium]
VYGLRGNVYRSDDAGKTWAKAEAGLPAAIVGAASAPDGMILLADGGGRIVASADGGRTFNKIALKNPMPLTGFAPIGGDRFVLVGPRGATVSEVAARQ